MPDDSDDEPPLSWRWSRDPRVTHNSPQIVIDVLADILAGLGADPREEPLKFARHDTTVRVPPRRSTVPFNLTTLENMIASRLSDVLGVTITTEELTFYQSDGALCLRFKIPRYYF